MNYDRYYTHDLVNGEGIRVALFVTGCQHACDGCYNKSTWDRKLGNLFTQEIQTKILDACGTHDGLSLSGGDPLHMANRNDITLLCKSFKERYPDKNIWLWTGYLYEDVATLGIMQYIDVLIDGKYDKNLKTTKPWRGSDNQRLIRLSNGNLTKKD